jgi:hypothetical protein
MAFVQSANDPYSSLGPNAAALAEDYATTGNKIIEVTTQIVVLCAIAATFDGSQCVQW